MQRSTKTGQKAQESLNRPVGQYEKKDADHKSESKLSGKDWIWWGMEPRTNINKFEV